MHSGSIFSAAEQATCRASSSTNAVPGHCAGRLAAGATQWLHLAMLAWTFWRRSSSHPNCTSKLEFSKWHRVLSNCEAWKSQRMHFCFLHFLPAIYICPFPIFFPIPFPSKEWRERNLLQRCWSHLAFGFTQNRKENRSCSTAFFPKMSNAVPSSPFFYPKLDFPWPSTPS